MTANYAIALHGGAGVDPARDYREVEDHLADLIARCADKMGAGLSAIDAVEWAVSELEASGLYVAGRGSAPNDRGFVECDAAIMDGASGKAGGVCALQEVANPVRAARLVLDETPFVLLAGDGARRFALDHGCARVGDAAAHYRLPVGVEQEDLSRLDPGLVHGTVGAVALDLEGKELWRRDLGPYVGIHGSASSPIIAGSLVVLANDQMDPKVMKRFLPKDASMVPEKSFLIAVDRKTGKTRWKIDRRTVLAGYSTPCVRQTGGAAPEVVFSGTAHGMTGVDLATGKVNWEIKGILNSRVVGSPQLYEDLVFGSYGSGLSAQRLVAVRAPRKGGVKEPKVAYDVSQSPPLVPSCLIKDDLLFLWTDSGIASCLDAATGKRHWRERVGGNYYSSPVWIDGRLYCTSKEGDVVVLAADKKFKLLAKNPLGEKCFAINAE